LVVLVLLATLAAGAALVTAKRSAADAPLSSTSWRRPVVTAAVAAVAIGLVVGGLGEKPTKDELSSGATARRLTTISSNRYEYWKVGFGAFARDPLRGLGAGGFRVEWLKERTIAESVRDVHSLELEMAVELGLIGLLAFGLFAGGVGWAAVRDLRRGAEAAGPAAATAAWLVHASIDWDWQMPAVTLPAVTLAAALIALDEISVRAP
jgi:O-antigen ligase